MNKFEIGPFQIAALRVKLNELREDLDESVSKQDFSRAAELKLAISEVESERDSLVLETTNREMSVVEETRIERVSASVY